jgi:hypothetical protein
MEARQVIGVADVHARTLADSLQALEDLDVFGGVVRPRDRHFETSLKRVFRIRPPARYEAFAAYHRAPGVPIFKSFVFS